MAHAAGEAHATSKLGYMYLERLGVQNVIDAMLHMKSCPPVVTVIAQLADDRGFL